MKFSGRRSGVEHAPYGMGILALLQSVESLLALTPDFARLAALERRLGPTGVSVFARRDGGRSDL